MTPVVDQPDWASPGGGTPAQKIGAAIGTTGTLLLGNNAGTARAVKVDSSGRLVTSGGGAAGTHVTHAAPFAYNSTGILTGHTLVFNDGYTVTVNDWLVDAWVEIDTAWNGTTPYGDYGQFASGDVAGFLYGCLGMSPIRMDFPDTTGNYGFNELLLGYSNASKLSTLSTLAAVNGLLTTGSSGPPYTIQDGAGYSLERGNRFFPAKFTTTSVMKMLVSQTGLHGGANPGATHGAGVFYMTTCTPA